MGLLLWIAYLLDWSPLQHSRRGAFSAILATCIGSVVWSRGIATIGVGQRATYLSWVPIFGVSFGALFLQEPVTVWHLVELATVIAGSFLVVRQR